MNNKTGYCIVKCLETDSVYRWSISEMLEEINRDRSDEWTDYTVKEWRDGWSQFVEGNYFTLLGEETWPYSI